MCDLIGLVSNTRLVVVAGNRPLDRSTQTPHGDRIMYRDNALHGDVYVL